MEASFGVDLFEFGEVVWYVRFWVGLLQDEMASCCEGHEEVG